MKKLYLYFSLLSIMPALIWTGGAESQFRFVYYLVMVLFIPLLNSNAMLRAAWAFSILYAVLPFLKAGEYPFYTITINAASFMMMAVASGRLADTVRKDRDALQRKSDIFLRLTNTLNLQIMNLQSTVDSLKEAYLQSQESDKNKTFFISNVSH
ncbi:MAG: hypothetical protein OEW04_09630, partial [Nitrospirota bacterium]|nr:hypothetical protein [Nitrospirota bacterium]